MAPVYNYTGTFEDVVIPPDDISGIESMYGVRKGNAFIEQWDNMCEDIPMELNFHRKRKLP